MLQDGRLSPAIAGAALDRTVQCARCHSALVIPLPCVEHVQASPKHAGDVIRNQEITHDSQRPLRLQSLPC